MSDIDIDIDTTFVADTFTGETRKESLQSLMMIC